MHKLHGIALLSWPNVHQLRLLSTQEQEKAMHDVQDVIDRFKRDEGLGSTAVTAPADLCEGSVSGSDKHSKKKLKIMDFAVYRDTDVI
jgi:hypothetical protein